ncbi:MAG: hypothetical protein SPJ42_05580 [Oscillospiraceae bacterium]|nr:hypothetical protein [Clostridiaceae bacterium]MDY5948693.1 hypothetical protein [Oscillospiraceae bacterium]
MFRRPSKTKESKFPCTSSAMPKHCKRVNPEKMLPRVIIKYAEKP